MYLRYRQAVMGKLSSAQFRMTSAKWVNFQGGGNLSFPGSLSWSLNLFCFQWKKLRVQQNLNAFSNHPVSPQCPKLFNSILLPIFSSPEICFFMCWQCGGFIEELFAKPQFLPFLTCSFTVQWMQWQYARFKEVRTMLYPEYLTWN